MHLLFSYARRAEPPLSRGDVVPPGYPSGSGETGGDTPLSSARRTRPRRGGAGSGIKVRQSWTFMGIFMASRCGAGLKMREAHFVQGLHCARSNTITHPEKGGFTIYVYSN